ncbi:MAG: SAM-dependent methyltransferase, partial [Ferrovibrio sp.]
AGFALPVADSEIIPVTYGDAFSLMRDLRGMGETNAVLARRKGFTRRATLLRMVELYQQRFAGPDGRIPATFEMISLTGWSPHESQQKPLRPGQATRSLADALGTVAHPIGGPLKPN